MRRGIFASFLLTVKYFLGALYLDDLKNIGYLLFELVLEFREYGLRLWCRRIHKLTEGIERLNVLVVPDALLAGIVSMGITVIVERLLLQASLLAVVASDAIVTLRQFLVHLLQWATILALDLLSRRHWRCLWHILCHLDRYLAIYFSNMRLHLLLGVSLVFLINLVQNDLSFLCDALANEFLRDVLRLLCPLVYNI